jgi:hypothetical protein
MLASKVNAIIEQYCVKSMAPQDQSLGSGEKPWKKITEVREFGLLERFQSGRFLASKCPSDLEPPGYCSISHSEIMPLA